MRTRVLNDGTELAYRYVHGGFKAKKVKFSFCFPRRDAYKGRFFQYLSPFPGPDEEMASLNKKGADEHCCRTAPGVDDGYRILPVPDGVCRPSFYDLLALRRNVEVILNGRVAEDGLEIIEHRLLAFPGPVFAVFVLYPVYLLRLVDSVPEGDAVSIPLPQRKGYDNAPSRPGQGSVRSGSRCP